MRILRSLLVALAVLPFLMPSGMCLCQCAHADDADHATTVGAISHSPHADSDRPCERCCSRHSVPPTEQSSDRRHGESKPPTPRTPTHHPDCPVLVGLFVRVAPPLASASAEVAQPGLTLLSVRIAPIRAEVTGPPADSKHSVGSLFISHCALLI